MILSFSLFTSHFDNFSQNPINFVFILFFKQSHQNDHHVQNSSFSHELANGIRLTIILHPAYTRCLFDGSQIGSIRIGRISARLPLFEGALIHITTSKYADIIVGSFLLQGPLFRHAGYVRPRPSCPRLNAAIRDVFSRQCAFGPRIRR